MLAIKINSLIKQHDQIKHIGVISTHLKMINHCCPNAYRLQCCKCALFLGELFPESIFSALPKNDGKLIVFK